SLARVQFLAGDKPVAATCSCTPLPLADGELGLLLVAIDRIAPDVVEAAGTLAGDPMTTALLPAGTDHLLLEAGQPIAGSSNALALGATGIADTPGLIRLLASPDGAELLLFSGAAPAAAATIETVRADEGESADDSDAERDLA